jgi:hypothetical protein
MSRLLLLMLLQVCFSVSRGQEISPPISDHQRQFQHNHIGFMVARNWIQKANTEWRWGPYELNSQIMRGWEAGVDYFIHFRNKSYSLVLGLHGRSVERNFDAFIPKEDFSPPLQEDIALNKRLTVMTDLHFYIPISVEKRWFASNKNFWNLQGGVAVGFYPDEINEIWTVTPDPSQPPAVYLALLVSSNFQPWINYVIGGGYTWTLGNNNLISAKLQMNYCSFNLAKGGYEFNVPGKPQSSGKYYSRLSGAGISVSYILTSSRKKEIKQFKKALKEKGV